MRREARGSEARGHLDRRSVRSRYVQLFDALADPVGQPSRSGQLRSGKDDGDLLAAVAPGKVELADRVCKDARHLAEHGVAGLVTEAVVDGLEVVDVGDHEADARAEATRVV